MFNSWMFNQKPINGVFRVLATPKRLSVPQFIEVRDIESNTVALLSPESDGLKNCWIDDEQNGSCTLEFELPLDNPKWQYLTDQYRIYAGGKEFVILNPDAVDKQRDGKKLKGKVKAHESWVLLGKKYQTICNDPLIGTPPWGAVIIVSGGSDLSNGHYPVGSAGHALYALLQSTGWTVGTVDVPGTYDLETEKESVLYNINQVQEKWGGILIWDSINKTVSLRDEATYKPYTGFQIRYAKNLKGITRTDDYDIVTRLYPFGENDLNIANVNGGLLYLDNHSYSDDILEGVWYNQDIADQTQLKIAGEKQLAVMCRPRHNYKTEVLDLRSLLGYGHETFKRSDMVDLIDEDLGIDTQVRIIRYRYNVFQPWLCDMELGDPLEKIQATVAQTVLMAKFYKNVVAPNTSFQNLLKAIINTAATEINGASGDYTLVDGVSTWFDRDPETGELTGKLLRITPQGLIISHDGGQTWKLAISGEGIHADAGWVGKLNAGVVTIGPETTFAPGYDPTQISSASMGVDSDCVGLWHFDGSLNSHKGVAADSNADYNTGLFGQALNIATGKHLKVPAAGLSASQGTISFRAKNLAESGNGSVLVDLPKSDNTQGLRAGIANDGKVYLTDNTTAAYGPNKSTLTGWDSISLAWKPDRLSLVVNDEEACYIENPGLPASLGSHVFIGTDRNGNNAINTLVDELRIDKVYREVNIRTGWHKTGVPFYTSEDMKQWPGYMRLETDGLKVYDSSDDLRVLVGSWLKDAVRKYGIKIIDGEIYSSLISTGPEGDDRGAIKIQHVSNPDYPDFNWGSIELIGGSGKKLMVMGIESQQPSLRFYDETSTDPYYLPAGYLYLATAGTTKEMALFANDRGLSLSTLNEYITMGATSGVQGQRGIGITGFRSDLNPIEDGWANLGQANRRWWTGFIVYTQTGDLCFSEQTCAICGGRFESGDVLALLTEAILEDGYTYTIPVHEKCKDIEKTIEVKVPEMTTKYRVNDHGEVEPYKTPAFEEVEEEILRVHPDYELDENTGKFKRKLNDWNRQFYSEEELLNGVYSSERGAKVRDTVIRKKPKFRTLSIQVGKPPE